ncbi:protein of unknown function [Methylacidimicrobium sp. AP8]|nr:protein of unknown function [Methylacidimicrobium sp. AP8]
MTELIPLDSLRNAAVFGDLPLYRPTSSGQGSILGSSAEAPYPFLTFRPPEAPNFGSENGGPAECSAYPVAHPLDFHFSSVSSEAKGASLGRAQTPNSSLFWPSVPTSGADLLAWPTSVGLAEGGVQHPLLEMAVASARGLARLLSAGKGWASDGNSWSGAFGKLFGVLSSQVGKAFLSGKVHQAAAAGLAERSSGASIRAQPMVPGNPGSSANQSRTGRLLTLVAPFALRRRRLPRRGDAGSLCVAVAGGHARRESCRKSDLPAV